MIFLSRRGMIAAVLVAFAGGALAFFIRAASPARPPIDPEQTLNRAIELLRGYRLDEAEPLLHAYLREYPDGVNGRLLMAQLALERAGSTDPPGTAPSRRALEHLGRIKTTSATLPSGAGPMAPSDEPRERDLAALVRLYQGKARANLAEPAAAEAAWDAALRLNPGFAEAGWLLMDLYVHQGREAEARRLGLRMAGQEADPEKRLEWLLSLAWLDTTRVAPQRVVRRFQEAVRRSPGDPHAAIALGLALIRERRDEEGLEILRRTVDRAPDDPDALAALLTGLWESQRTETLIEAVGRIPPDWAGTTAFAEPIGLATYARHDWRAAATALRRAHEAEPHRIELALLLARALRLSGEESEADRLGSRIRALRRHRDELLERYKRLFDPSDPAQSRVADDVDFSGGAPAAAQSLIGLHDPAPLRRFAELCDELGFADQARAWRGALAELYPSAR
jgi:tetratricopeptide (TPR) repeat protein